jgi:hypothetical protein
MTTRLADRLAAARRRFFIGRRAEKQMFQEALAAVEPPFFVLHIYGPGGVGKTSLLHELILLAQQTAVQAVYLDVRNVEPTPDSFLVALTLAAGGAPPTNPLDLLGPQGQRTVLLVDTYETLTPLDAWLRDLFLPQFPANGLVVLAGRTPPAAAWRSDPGWQSLVRVLPLRNLTPEESHAYLNARTIAPAEHERIAHFTHGHPLAISLVADVLEQNPELHFEPTSTPDLVRTLLERFVQETPSPAHRFALEASALVRQMTESLLAAMLEMPDVHELFGWLRGLSFMDAGRQGLFPHDLVREALTADLRWRNPDWYAELHKRARTYYMDRLHQTQGPNQRRILLDFVYLHRDNFVLRPYFETFFEGHDVPTLWVDRMQPQDQRLLLQMVGNHEGEESARLAEHWFKRQPEATVVVRDGRQQALGFLTMLALHEATAEDIAVDPGVQNAWNYLRGHGPLRAGELGIYFRFWMDHESYQEMSPVQSRIYLVCLQYYLTTPGLVFTFFACSDPDFWLPIFTYADLSRLVEADFTVGGRTYGVYGHDWRLMPPTAWLELMAEREIAMGLVDTPTTAPTTAPSPVLVLSQPDFAEAVRDALKSYTRSNDLQENPLLRSRLVLERTHGDVPMTERVSMLQNLIKEATERLQASPRQAKLYRALYHTYLKPAATQELAAELLDVPFSTYRRHLKAGVDEVVAYLWHQELASIGV